MALTELDTRMVPWQRIEETHARNRPHNERPPLPQPGQRIWWRQHDWERAPDGTHTPPELATVLRVEPDDDPTSRDYVDGVGWVRDPNLWHLVRDAFGVPRHRADGSLLYAPAADPWPWLELRRDDDEHGHPRPLVRCREARLRGSAGWLPLDYRQRPERNRLPTDLLAATRPVLPPLNVP